jgi:hypothetical protein
VLPYRAREGREKHGELNTHRINVAEVAEEPGEGVIDASVSSRTLVGSCEAFSFNK